MNRRQRSKIIPSEWIIIRRMDEQLSIDEQPPTYELWAFDWKRGARMNWEGWNKREELLASHVPVRRKIGGMAIQSIPVAKLAKQAQWLSLNEQQYEQMQQFLYQSVTYREWKKWKQTLYSPL
ncbi:hypothetical protein [Paenibacillus kandeliae]|uniref:hypothetical protein n=1 Tax=Paenibacillus kandeliae TaxID=3231269 RepID=UPI003458CDC4